MTDKFFQGTYRTNTSYPRYSIVVDGNSANKLLYIATQDVPRNTPLSNTSYWIKYDVENGAVTPEEVLEMIEEITGDLEDLTTEDKTNLVSAINELVSRPTPVQADWEQTDETALDFIKNKPTISGGADWDAQEGEDGFIENKPFDVPSGSQKSVFDANLEYLGEESYVDGYAYEGMDDIPELSPSDEGKTVIVTVNGREMTSTLMHQTEMQQNEVIDLYYATKDFDLENDQFTSNEGFLLQIIDTTEVSLNKILCCLPDEVTTGVECSVVVSEVSLSKLSGDKIQIDGTSIISDDGVLKATAPPQEQADWNESDPTDVSFIKNKPTISPQEQADWNESSPNDVAFIKNKPFDVQTGSQKSIFASFLAYQGEETQVDGYVYLGTDDVPELSPSDAGKTVIVSVNGRTMEAVLEYTLYPPDNAVYSASYNFEDDEFLSNLGFALYINPLQNNVMVCLPDEVSTGVECSVKVSDVSLSKLSGDKIQIDGESIVSDDGVLKATVDVPIATTSVAGKVKPDGTSITVDGIGKISAKDNYSTDEQVIGTWIDGKPLYRRTISLTSPSVSTYSTIAHNISDVDTIWIDESASFVKNGSSFIPFNANSKNADWSFWSFVNNTSIAFTGLPTNLQELPTYATLKYTKTTD